MGMLRGRPHLERPFLPRSSSARSSCSAWLPGRRAWQRPLLGAALEAAIVSTRLLTVGAEPEHQRPQSGPLSTPGCRVSSQVLEEPQVLRLLMPNGSCPADASSPVSAASRHKLAASIHTLQPPCSAAG